jgi:hypothetical protein
LNIVLAKKEKYAFPYKGHLNAAKYAFPYNLNAFCHSVLEQ